MVQFQHVLDGAARILCNGEPVVIRKGDSVINAPDCNPRIDERLTATGKTLRAFIAPYVFDAAARGTRLPPAQALEAQPIFQSGLHALLEELVCAVERQWPFAKAGEALAKFVHGVDRSLQAQPAAAGRHRRREEVERARQILYERFNQPVSLDELTAETGLSKFHLLRMFRGEIGATPHAYQLHLRVSHAREMLDRGLPAAEVAMQCGFADQAHFTRCFKRIVGYTPVAFVRVDHQEAAGR